MFGYLKAFTAELKMKDYDIYRGMYCSLCNTLGKRYGALSRMLLNYDLSFLTLFLTSLSEECCGFNDGKCPFNPSKKCKYTKQITHELELAADACVILSYYKILDNIHDGTPKKKLAARLSLPYAGGLLKKARKLNSDLCDQIKEYAASQENIEASPGASIDSAAEPSAKLLSSLFSADENDPDQKLVRERFGYCLGRWIYLIDACDDYFDDEENNNYNPYIRIFNEIKDTNIIHEKMKGDLNEAAAEAALAFELLDVKRFRDIIENIVYDGLFNEAQAVLKKRFDTVP